VTRARTGVLLINLGTPDSPSTRDVRRYLREFLSDPRVIDISAPARFALLNFVILPLRPRRAARQYASVWMEDGSPLLVHGRALEASVSAALGDAYAVELAMRYGNPSIRSGLDALCAAGVERIAALPLFPQYSDAATGSALARLEEEHARVADAPPLATLRSFYDDPGFIDAEREVAAPVLEAFAPDYVLMSFHGLPERQVKRSDASGSHCLVSATCCDAIGAHNRECYRAHCYATARAIAAALDLPSDGHGVAFQSRLGRTPWIRPYTDELLPELAARGVKRLAVMCPAFVADCLETVEEISVRAAEQWEQLGGEALQLVPSLNAAPRWTQAVAEMAKRVAEGGVEAVPGSGQQGAGRGDS
jgi:ferrochelatase